MPNQWDFGNSFIHAFNASRDRKLDKERLAIQKQVQEEQLRLQREQLTELIRRNKSDEARADTAQALETRAYTDQFVDDPTYAQRPEVTSLAAMMQPKVQLPVRGEMSKNLTGKIRSDVLASTTQSKANAKQIEVADNELRLNRPITVDEAMSRATGGILRVGQETTIGDYARMAGDELQRQNAIKITGMQTAAQNAHLQFQREQWEEQKGILRDAAAAQFSLGQPDNFAPKTELARDLPLFSFTGESKYSNFLRELPVFSQVGKFWDRMGEPSAETVARNVDYFEQPLGELNSIYTGLITRAREQGRDTPSLEALGLVMQTPRGKAIANDLLMKYFQLSDPNTQIDPRERARLRAVYQAQGLRAGLNLEAVYQQSRQPAESKE